jgi:hypothetical protein
MAYPDEGYFQTSKYPQKAKKYIMRANKSSTTKDKFREYQFENIYEVTKRIKKILDNKIDD